MGTIVADHMARQLEITNRQDSTIAAIVDRILKLPNIGGPSEVQSRFADNAMGVRRSIKLEFPRFSSDDLEGWLY